MIWEISVKEKSGMRNWYSKPVVRVFLIHVKKGNSPISGKTFNSVKTENFSGLYFSSTLFFSSFCTSLVQPIIALGLGIGNVHLLLARFAIAGLGCCIASYRLHLVSNLLLSRKKQHRVAVISAKNHKRQRHKRQSVTAKREKSQTPKVLTAILTLPNLT